MEAVYWREIIRGIFFGMFDFSINLDTIGDVLVWFFFYICIFIWFFFLIWIEIYFYVLSGIGELFMVDDCLLEFGKGGMIIDYKEMEVMEYEGIVLYIFVVILYMIYKYMYITCDIMY